MTVDNETRVPCLERDDDYTRRELLLLFDFSHHERDRGISYEPMMDAIRKHAAEHKPRSHQDVVVDFVKLSAAVGPPETDLETRLMALMADHGMDVIDPEKPIEELYDYILDWAFRDLHLMAQALGLAPPAASNEKSEA